MQRKTITASDNWTIWFPRNTATGGFIYNQGNASGTESGIISNTGTSHPFAVNISTGSAALNNYNKSVMAGNLALSNFSAFGMTTIGNGGNISVINDSTGGYEYQAVPDQHFI